MAKPKDNTPAPVQALEQPQLGGNYIRHPDGRLERVEHTKEPKPPADEAPAEELKP